MSKIAVMGDYDSIYGFASLGLEIIDVNDDEEAVKILRRLADSDYAVVYITEELALRIREELDLYSGRITPAIVFIPVSKGNTCLGIAMVKTSVERAFGSDIIFNDK